MAGNEWILDRWQIAFDDMQVSAAHTTCDDSEQNITGGGLWAINILDVDVPYSEVVAEQFSQYWNTSAPPKA